MIKAAAMDWNMLPLMLVLFAALILPGAAQQNDSNGTAVSSVPQAPFVLTLNVNYTSTAVTVRWTTDVPSDSQVEYGTAPGYGHSSEADGAMAASHLQTIFGLTANATYYLRVKSRDASGNAGYSDAIEFATPPNATATAVPTSVGLDSSLESAIAAAKPGEPAVLSGSISNRGAEEVLNLTLNVIGPAGGMNISLMQPIAAIPPFSSTQFRIRVTLAPDASGSTAIGFFFAGSTASGMPASTARMGASINAITPQPPAPVPAPAPTLQEAPRPTAPPAVSKRPGIDALEKAALDVMARADALNQTEISASVREALGLLSTTSSDADVERASSIISQGRARLEAVERKRASGVAQEPDALHYVTAIVVALAVIAALYWQFSRGNGPRKPVGREPPQAQPPRPTEIAYG